MPTDDQIEAAARALTGLSKRLWDREKNGAHVAYYWDAARAALEAAEAIDEWEYGERSLSGITTWVVDRDNSPRIWADIEPERRVRRRKASPWIALEGETDHER